MKMNRRGLLVGLGASLFAAPAIVRAGSLMPVKVMRDIRVAYDPLTETVAYNVMGFDHMGMRVYETILVPRVLHDASSIGSIAYIADHTEMVRRVTSFDYHDGKTGEGGIYLSPEVVIGPGIKPPPSEKGILYKGHCGIDLPLGENPWARASEVAWTVVEPS